MIIWKLYLLCFNFNKNCYKSRSLICMTKAIPLFYSFSLKSYKEFSIYIWNKLGNSTVKCYARQLPLRPRSTLVPVEKSCLFSSVLSGCFRNKLLPPEHMINVRLNRPRKLLKASAIPTTAFAADWSAEMTVSDVMSFLISQHWKK